MGYYFAHEGNYFCSKSDNKYLYGTPILSAEITTSDTSSCKNFPEPEINFKGYNGTPPYTFYFDISSGTDEYTDNDSSTLVSDEFGDGTTTVPTDNIKLYKYVLTKVIDDDSVENDTLDDTCIIQILQTPTGQISGNNTVEQGSSPPQVTFTGSAGTAPYTFTYTINDGDPSSATTTIGNSVNAWQPTDEIGVFYWELTKIEHEGNYCYQEYTDASIAVVVIEPE